MAKEIRFAVGDKGDLRSSVWRLWSGKDELYLAARSLAGLSKISFHSSGICRHAVVSKAPRPPIDSWRRPKQSDPGVTPLFDIVVPSFAVDRAYRDKLPPPNKRTLFLKAPDHGAKIIIRVLLADATLAEEDLRKLARGKPVHFHGSVPLRREAAWLVSYYDKLKAAEQDFVAEIIRTTKINLAPGSSTDDLVSASLHSYEGKNPRMVVDLQLGPENLYVEAS